MEKICEAIARKIFCGCAWTKAKEWSTDHPVIPDGDYRILYIDIPSPKLPGVNSWYLEGRMPRNYLIIIQCCECRNITSLIAVPLYRCKWQHHIWEQEHGQEVICIRRQSNHDLQRSHWLLTTSVCMCIGVLSSKINKPWKKILVPWPVCERSLVIFRAAVQLQEA